MKRISGINNFRSEQVKKPIIVAIGTFDGVHLAHRDIIKKAVRQAKATKGTSVVLTFYPHPMRVTNPGKKPALLTSIEHRLELISDLDPDICIVAEFKKKFANMNADNFVQGILVNKLNVSKVIIGDNFTFGKNKSGNIEYLKDCSKKAGFKVQAIKALKKNGKVISSSLIRKFIESGKIDKANEFLGRKFSILGTVIKGDSRGRVLGYPTANIDPHQEALPPKGVYAVRALINNKWYKGMLNIGMRPTFYLNQNKLTIEANIFDFDKFIYNQVIELFFIKKLRNEKKFTSADELKKQLYKDQLKAKKLLG